MPRVLSEGAERMLGYMPPMYRADPNMQAVMQAQASEDARIERAAAAIRDALFPSQSDDIALLGGRGRFPALSMYEMVLQLPVNPPGAALTARIAKVLARIRNRKSGAGTDWIAAITTALGTADWSHLEGPGDYQVTITLPGDPTGYNTGAVAAMLRKITPAHLDIILAYESGFLVEISQIELEAL